MAALQKAAWGLVMLAKASKGLRVVEPEAALRFRGSRCDLLSG